MTACHTYPYTMVDGHVILDRDGKRLLVDTGAPSTVYSKASVFFAGNLADRETLYAIADALMDLTRSDLAVCTITSEKGEVVFPFPRRHEKRPQDA